MADQTLLLIITIAVFFLMYLCAMIFLGSGFLKPQTFFNILNDNAALIILSCGMSLVMITGGIDISVGALTALVCMSCTVNLDYNGDNVLTAILIALGIGLAFGLVQRLYYSLSGNPAIYRDSGRYIFRQGNDNNSKCNTVQCCIRRIPGS